MATYTSPKLSWAIPNEFEESDLWGGELNAIFDDIDTLLGTMTADGIFAVKTDSYTAVNLGSLTGTVNVDCSAGRFFYGTVTAACTLSLSNLPASGRAVFIMFEITNGSAFTLTWPTSFDWPGGVPPTLTAAGVDVVAAYTRDGGTTWHAALAQKDTK